MTETAPFYWLEVDALTRPMQVREPKPLPYGGQTS
jgi:hypothetical protein